MNKIGFILLSALALPFTAAADSSLRLGKQALVLLNDAGQPVSELPMRAKQLDVRPGLALVIDSATGHVQPVRVDAAGGALHRMAPLPVQAFGVESACLFRDRQGIDFAFIAGKDGQAEQWLLGADGARLVRKLSLPVDPGQCKVDDASHMLLVTEDGVGTWAYEADSEASPRRTLLKGGKRPPVVPEVVAVVMPRAQTDAVAKLGDVADDPAIWVHPQDPAKSRVLGTNKKQGLMVYDMAGHQTQLLESGRLNNVDLRQGVLFEGQPFDLAVASQRDANVVVVYGIDAAGTVAELTRFASGFQEIYGICLFQPRAGGLEVIVNDKGGQFHQYRLGRSAGAWSAALTRQFKVASQPEGCVADDRNERLFIGEEKRGVWTLPAGSEQAPRMRLVLGVGKQLRADVEGLAVYVGARDSYLVVSSQGDSSYVVLDAAAPYRVRGRFKVGFNLAQGIDGTSETDGLEVSSRNLGGAYAHGMLVIHDGYRRMPDGPQNFKYVGWEDVARALQLPLEK